MTMFKGALYVGSGIQGGGIDTQNKIGPAPPELIRIHPDGSWDLIVGEGATRRPDARTRSRASCRASTTSSTATSGACASTTAGST